MGKAIQSYSLLCSEHYKFPLFKQGNEVLKTFKAIQMLLNVIFTLAGCEKIISKIIEVMSNEGSLSF